MREKIDEALRLIAERHDLCVYFDFNIDTNVLGFRFYIDECEILKSSLKLSEINSNRVFELLEKEVEERIETLKSKLNDKKMDEKMSECLKRDICKNHGLKCTNCKEIAIDYFEPKELSDTMCLCVSCKNIITNGHIFPFKVDPRRGLCFKCY